MRIFTLLLLALSVTPLGAAEKKAEKEGPAEDVKTEALAKRPRVPGRLAVTLRDRQKTPAGTVRPRTRRVEWTASETAVIIHAPSGCMDVYAKTAHRWRMKLAPATKTPIPLKGWCYRDPEREPELPVDVSKQPCDDPVVGKAVRRFSKQHDAIKITGFDGVSHSGQEIYNVLHREGIRNVVLMGVHTNMCVLGRPFGIRQLVRLGFNVALARDLTDAMYDPRQAPFVSHTRGTQLVVEHIETYWCPSLLGADLTRIVPGSADPVVGTK